MMSSVLFFSTALSCALADMGHWDDDFSYSTYLEEDHQFRLYWSHLDDDVIDIGMEANTTGWIAVGLSPNGGMENSDIMLGWVDDDGTVTLQDRYTGDSTTRPSLDDEDHLTLIEGEEEDGITRIRFQRTRTLSCDDTSDHDMAVSQGTSRVIYAFHDDDGDADDTDSINYHGATQRGSQSVNLWYGESAVVELEADAEYIDFTMTNWSLTSEDTTYVCKLFQLPTFDETQHVVMFEPIVQEGNEGTVHHVVLYMCPEDYVSGEVLDTHQADCDDWSELNMPSEDCRSARLEYAWAIGGGPTYYPIEAGLPMSGNSSLHYVFIDVHYDNPEERSDIVDSSGIRMWYTPTLREHDAGLLWFGVIATSDRQFTVPGTVSTVTGYCHADCTEEQLDESGVYAFGALLHAHTTATAISLRHIRNGTELEPLEINDHYDFDYQQTTFFDEPVTILPGDQFIVHCTYDTMDRDDMVLGGEATSDEMCIAFVYVYPKPDFYNCVSGFSEDAVSQWLDDAYDEGYWDINMTYNGSSYTIEDLMDEGYISSPGEVIPEDWDLYGGFWNYEKEGAAAFYEQFWNGSAYSERFSQCWDGKDGYSAAITTFEDEFGEFDEYCTDSCECGEEDTQSTEEDESDTAMIVGIAIGVVAMIVIALVVAVVLLKNRSVEAAMKGQHVPHTSTNSGGQTAGASE